MFSYIIRRLFQLIPVVLGVTFIVFTLTYTSPGDPARMLLPQDAKDEEGRKIVRNQAQAMIKEIQTGCEDECKQKGTEKQALCLANAKSMADLQACK